MKRFISLLVSIPLILVIAAFTFKNAQLVTVDLFTVQLDLPLTVILLIAMLIGVILGYAINLVTLFSQKRTIRRLQRKKETLQGLSGVLQKPGK
ncbi:MAG TPA: LapA family protein [Gammaproteobacteria bacterium]